MDDGGNRLGFQFAAVSLAGEDGTGSDVTGTRARIATFAAVLMRHPRLHCTVEAHCGPTAPPSIAFSYSLERAELIIAELMRHGVGRERITPVGHGKRISASVAMLRSTHPNARSARHGNGWAELFLHFPATQAASCMELPRRPDYSPPVPPEKGAASCLGGMRGPHRLAHGHAIDEPVSEDTDGRGSRGSGGLSSAANPESRRGRVCLIS